MHTLTLQTHTHTQQIQPLEQDGQPKFLWQWETHSPELQAYPSLLQPGEYWSPSSEAAWETFFKVSLSTAHTHKHTCSQNLRTHTHTQSLAHSHVHVISTDTPSPVSLSLSLTLYHTSFFLYRLLVFSDSFKHVLSCTSTPLRCVFERALSVSGTDIYHVCKQRWNNAALLTVTDYRHEATNIYKLSKYTGVKI